MGFPRGMRRDRVALERRRLQAARLLEQGLTEAEVARRLGVTIDSPSQIKWTWTLNFPFKVAFGEIFKGVPLIPVLENHLLKAVKGLVNAFQPLFPVSTSETERRD